MEPFVHLHNHTEHSSLDGLQRQSKMVNYVRDVLGQTAIAATDHGNNDGTLELARCADEAGIKAIAGQEMYMALGSRFERNIEPSASAFEGSKERRYHHLTVLVGAPEGWRNLTLLNNEAWNHYFYQPRIDFESLTTYGDGLILGTGCLGGPVASRLMANDMEGARANTEKLLAAVKGDKDRLFVEVMNHNIPEERHVLPGLVEIADYFGLRLAATNDAHYTEAREAKAHDMLLAMQTNRQLSDPDRFRFNGDMGAYSLKSYDEMLESFRGTPIGPEALTNTQIIADMCPDNLLSILPQRPENGFRLPKLPLPPSVMESYVEGQFGCRNPHQYWLYLEVRQGIRERFGDHPDPGVLKQARYELDIINGFDVEDYMLIVKDVVQATRAQGYQIGAGRGSGAGSQTAFCLGITDVPPRNHNLLFERFLDVTRKGMPDFDLDFEQAALTWVVNYLREKFGNDCVAHLGTRGTKLAKAVLRDAGRLTGRPEVGAELAKTVATKKGGRTASVAEMMDPDNQDPSMRDIVARSADAREVLDLAAPLDGIMAMPGTHACGMIIADRPLIDVIPLRKSQKSNPESAWVTWWDGPEMESLGYLKLDRLGIRNLDIKGEAQRLIAEDFGRDLQDMRYGKISFTDEEAQAAWALLGQGRNRGIFQLDSDGMRKLMLGVQPRNLDDVSALLALYRPGPMGAKMHDHFVARRQGVESVSYDYLTKVPHEQREIDRVLNPTMGIIIYQEQVMELSAIVAGFGPGLKNKLRTTISKKKPAEMKVLESLFIEGAQIETQEGGFIEGLTPEGDTTSASVAFQESTARELWRTFSASADYLFNKCVAGQTEVVSAADHSTWTIEQLYRLIHADPQAPAGRCQHCLSESVQPPHVSCESCRQWLSDFRRSSGVMILAFDEKRQHIHPARMVDVHHNGERSVFRIALANGSSVRSTDNHRWLTPEGYRTTAQLRLGDALVTHAGDGRTAQTSTIMSIAADGVEAVYDIEMAEGTDHNFVANGIVSHNSHSVAYGMLTFQTAWLKANYPTHFAAALLSKTQDKKRFLVLESLRDEGITVERPDINTGSDHTTVSGPSSITLGLGEIKNVKQNIRYFLEERDANGPFTSLMDAVERVKVLNPKTGKMGKMSVSVFEALICAGAFDGLHHGEHGETQRAGMMMAIRALGGSKAPVLPVEWPAWEKAERERLFLGLLVSEHPLSVLGPQAYQAAKNVIPDTLEPAGLGELEVGDRRWVVAQVVSFSVQPMKSRPGRLARFTLEGTKNTVPGVMFNSDIERQEALMMMPEVGDFVVASVQVNAAYVRSQVDDDDSPDVDMHDSLDDDENLALDEKVVDEPQGIELIANRFYVLPIKAQSSMWPPWSTPRPQRTSHVPRAAQEVFEAEKYLAASPSTPPHAAEEETQETSSPSEDQREFHDVEISGSWAPTGMRSWRSLRHTHGGSLATPACENAALAGEMTQSFLAAKAKDPDLPWSHYGLGSDSDGRPYRLVNQPIVFD